MLSRRSLFLSVPLLGTMALAGCATASLSVGQAITDALGIANMLKAELPTIAVLFPHLIGEHATPLASFSNEAGTGWLDLAIQALNGLTSDAPLAITNLATAEANINLVLNALAPVVNAMALANPATAGIAIIIQAAISLAPAIEQLINQMAVPEPAKTGNKMAFRPVSVTRLASHVALLPPAEARSVLRISN